MWNKQNLAAAALSPILGLICSLIAWLVTAKKQGGNLSVASTGAKYAFSSFLKSHVQLYGRALYDQDANVVLD